MPTKKKAFTKHNSVKYAVLHGHETAQNADGKTLEHEWVPIDRNYKPGASLIMGRLAEFLNGPIPSEEFAPHSSISSKPCNGYLDKNLFHNDGTLFLTEEKMEKKFEEYEEGQIGPLEDEEIFGYLTGENKHIDYYLGKKKQEDDEEIDIGKCEESLREKILKYSEEDHVEKLVEIVTKHPPEFDCESIISTYSNKYNHPSIIREERKIRKSRLTKSKLRQLQSEYGEFSDNISVASINLKSEETPEERKERKKLFKEMKSENRKLKKENKIAFKNEKKFQQAQAINVQNNRGIRLF